MEFSTYEEVTSIDLVNHFGQRAARKRFDLAVKVLYGVHIANLVEIAERVKSAGAF